MTAPPSRMAAEIAEIPEVVTRLAAPEAQAALRAEGAALDALGPPFLLTVARGSSDHAATVLKYAVELSLGLPVASLGPSVASVWGARLRVRGAAALALSQSGASADLRALALSLREGGARVTALTNRPDSPLADAADATVDVRAGPEEAVAATKSFVATVVAGLWLVAHWTGDRRLAESLVALPDSCAQAIDADAAPLDAALAANGGLTVIGRGPRLGLALEAALKVRETLARPADGYSAAEVLHGPARIVAAGDHVVVFADYAGRGVAEAVARLAGQGAWIVPVASIAPDPDGVHPLAAAIPQVVAFYAAVEREARRRGLDPDRPPFLRKETVTT